MIRIERDFGDVLSLSENGQVLALYGFDQEIGSVSGFVYSYNGTVWERMGQPLSNVSDILLAANGQVVASISKDEGQGDYGHDGGDIQVWSWNEFSQTWEPLGIHSLQSFTSACGDGILHNNYCGVLRMSLSGDGHTLALSSQHPLAIHGQVFVFSFDAEQNQWYPLGQTLTVTGTSSSFARLLGVAVALSRDGTRVSVGPPGLVQSYEYSNETNQWTRVGPDLSGARIYPTIGMVGWDVFTSAHGQVVASGAAESTDILVAVWDETNAEWKPFPIKLNSFWKFRSNIYAVYPVGLSADGTTIALVVKTKDGYYELRIMSFH